MLIALGEQDDGDPETPMNELGSDRTGCPGYGTCYEDHTGLAFAQGLIEVRHIRDQIHLQPVFFHSLHALFIRVLGRAQQVNFSPVPLQRFGFC